MEMKMVFEASL